VGTSKEIYFTNYITMVDYKKYIKVLEILEKSEDSTQWKASAICELFDTEKQMAKLIQTPPRTIIDDLNKYPQAIPCWVENYPNQTNQ
jgi:hypothetical protein